MQGPAELIDVANWTRDEDFAIFPVGSKPKRALFCPSPSPYPFLIAGHRYMFKVSAGWRIHQHWSEVIAYRLSKIMPGPPCAPSYIAWDSTTGEVGVAVEFFYGHPDSGIPARFLPGADLLRRVFEDFDSDTDRRHTYQTIQLICRAFNISGRIEYWARILAFDALIGNTDRHSENWGLLAKLLPDSASFQFTMAPAFDHGTSLAYQLREEDIARESKPAAIKKHIDRGKHHLHISDESSVRGHFEVCRLIAGANEAAMAAMKQMTTISKDSVQTILDDCCAFELPSGKCSSERGDYLLNLLDARRNALASALEA